MKKHLLRNIIACSMAIALGIGIGAWGISASSAKSGREDKAPVATEKTVAAKEAASKPEQKPAPKPEQKPAPKPEQKPAPTTSEGITKEEAINIALGYLGDSSATLTDVERDWEDGVWELEFILGDMEYDFDIAISDGTIYHVEQDPLDYDDYYDHDDWNDHHDWDDDWDDHHDHDDHDWDDDWDD